MKVVHRSLFTLHVFVGIGAIFGGLAAILNPEQPLGASVEMLKNSPFKNFLIPGIILFTIIGLGNICAAMGICFKSKFQGYSSSVVSLALAIWIIVQCLIISSIHFLHIIFFIIGLIKIILSTIVLFKQNLFSANLIFDYYRRYTKAKIS